MSTARSLFFGLLLILGLVAHGTVRAGSLTVEASPAAGGTVTPAGTTTHENGADVTITATANPGWVFTTWTDDLVGNANQPSTSLIVSGTKKVTANFQQLTHSLSVNVLPAGAGTGVVTGEGATTVIPGLSTYLQTANTPVTLTVTPTPGNTAPGGVPWVFVGWVSSSATPPAFTSTTAPSTAFVMDASYAVTAIFGPAGATQYTLTAQSSTGGTVMIEDGVPGGVSVKTFTPGETARVAAWPSSPAYAFAGWIPGTVVPQTPDPSVDPLESMTDVRVGTLSVNSNKTVTASFVPVVRALTVATTPAGGGTLTLGPGAITTALGGNANINTYLYGSSVTLTATPAAGYRLTGFNNTNPAGAALGSPSPALPTTGAATVVVGPLTSPATITAVFEPIPVYRQVTLSTGPGGTATGTGSFVNPDTGVPVNLALAAPGGPLSAAAPGVVEGTVMTFTALPATHWQFHHWAGLTVNSTSNPAMVAASADLSVQAVFEQIDAALSLAVSPAAAGPAASLITVTGATPGPNGFYPINANLSLSATAPAGWLFTGWSGDVTGATSPASLVLSDNKSVTAHFIALWSMVADTDNGGLVQIGSGVPAASASATDLTDGTVVSLTASVADATKKAFLYWSGDAAGTGVTTDVTLDANKRATAHFIDLNTVQLFADAGGTAGASGVRGNTVASFTATSGGSAAGAFNVGSTVTLTATLAPGYAFTGWDLNNDGVISPSEPTGMNHSLTVLPDATGPQVIRAKFTQILRVLTASVQPAAAVAAGNAITGTTGSFPDGTTATLNATAVAGWKLSKWVLDGVDQPATPALSVTMSADHTIEAWFVPTFQLSTQVETVPGGTGGTALLTSPVAGGTATLTGSPAAAVLSATVNPTYVFSGWRLEKAGAVSGDGTFSSSSSLTPVLTLNGTPGSSYVAIATFTQAYTVTTAVDNTALGSVTPSGATGNLTHGSSFTVTAVPAVGSTLRGWYYQAEGAPSGTFVAPGAGNSYSFNVIENATVTALFSAAYPLTLNYSPTAAGTSAVPATITVSPAQPADGYGTYGQLVALTATGTPEWIFNGWAGDAVSTGGSGAQVTMTGPKTVTAKFLQAFPLTLAVSPADAGTTSPALGSTIYRQQGSTLTISATPAANHAFKNWTVSAGAAVTAPNSATTTVTADAAKVITANFVASYKAAPVAQGSGTVRINGSTAIATVAGPATLNLTATALAGYVFTGWRLEQPLGTASAAGTFANPAAATTTLAINGSAGLTYSVIATFARAHTVTTGVDNPANGSVSPSGVRNNLAHGSTYTITATPAAGRTLQGWYYQPASGTSTLLPVTGNTLALTVIENATVIALFQTGYNLTLNYSPANAPTSAYPASVSISPVMPPDGYPYGTAVSLVAIGSNEEWAFGSWTGPVSTTTSATTGLVMNGDKTVTVTFKPRYALTMATNPAGMGSTTPAVGTVNYYTTGTTVPLSAVAPAGYAFKEWVVSAGGLPAAVNDPVTTVVADATKTVTARFAPAELVTVRTQSLPGGGDVAGSTTTPATGPGGRAGMYVSATASYVAQATSFITTGGYTGSPVTVQAFQTAAGYTFAGWDLDGDGVVGAAEPTATSYTFTPTGATTVTAVFQRRQITLTLLADPDFAGTAIATTGATATPPGSNTYTVFWGDTVALQATAVPASGYSFARWTGGAVAAPLSAATSIVLTADTTLTAHFTPPAGTVNIYLFPEGEEDGDVFASAARANEPALTGGAYVTVNGRKARLYQAMIGQSVQIGATPVPGLVFGSWDGMPPHDVAPLNDRVLAPNPDKASNVIRALPLAAFTDIRLKAIFIPPTPRIQMKVEAALDGAVLPSGNQTVMPGADRPLGAGSWTVNGSLLDPLLARPWIQLYGSQVSDTFNYDAGAVETLTTSAPPVLTPYDFDGWNVNYYDTSGTLLLAETGSAASQAVLPKVLADLDNVHVLAKYVTKYIYLTVQKQVTGPDSASLTATADPASVNPAGVQVTVSGAMPQGIRFVRTSVAPALAASAGGASADYVFDGWDVQNDGSVDIGAPTVPAGWNASPAAQLATDVTATARFTRLHLLTVAVTPGDTTGSGTLHTVGLPNGVQAPASPNALRYRHGTAVSVLATPDLHYVMTGWKIETDTDDDGSLETVTTIPVAPTTAAQTYALPAGLIHATKITAIFAWESLPVSFEVAPAGTGDMALDGVTLTLPYTKADAHYGEQLGVVAQPAAGYLFSHWTVSAGANTASATAASTTLFVDQAKTLTAHFVKKVVLTMEADPAVSATTSVLTPAAGTHDYAINSPVTVNVAATDLHWAFAGWKINGVAQGTATDTSLPLILSADTVATATFTPQQILTVNVTPAGVGGNATADGSAGPSPSQYLYAKGAPATITANPGPGGAVTTAGYIFDHWEIDGLVAPGGAALTIGALNNDAIVTAVYAKHPGYAVTLQSSPAGAVQTLTATDGTTPRDYLTSPGAQNYPWHASVTVSASPAPGYVFVRWMSGGATVATSATYALPILTADVNLTAVFEPSFTLGVTQQTLPATAPAGGTVTINTPPPGGSSVSLHGANQLVGLTATANPGYVFAGWRLESNGVSSVDGTFADATLATTALTLSGGPGGTYSAVATFKKIFTVILGVDDPSHGSVSPTGSVTVPYGGALPVTATGAGTFSLQGWYYVSATNPGAIVGAGSPYTFTITEDCSITAFFQTAYKLTVNYVPAAAATNATPAVVTLSPSVPGNNYAYNTAVTLSTASTLRWEFDHWEYPAGTSITGASTSVRMTADRTVAAHYKPRYPITLAVSPVGAGTTSPAASTTNYYTQGVSVPLTATAATGYDFSFWSVNTGMPVNAPSSASTTVPADAAKTVTANFQKRWTVTVNAATTTLPPFTQPGASTSTPGAGTYYVTPSAAGNPNGIFELTAAPEAGWEFVTWYATGGYTFTGGTSVTSSTATLAVNGDVSITARFRKQRHNLTVTSSPAAGGSSSVSPGSVVIPPATVTGVYEHGTLVTIAAAAAPGYRFIGWSGDTVVLPDLTQPFLSTLVMNGDRNVVAQFEETRALRILLSPADGSGGSVQATDPVNSSGTVTVSGPANATFIYPINQAVALNAVPAANYAFQEWAGPVTPSTSASANVTVSGNPTTVMAIFRAVQPSVPLTVVASPADAGVVSIGSGSPGASVTATVEPGFNTNISASVTNPRYQFSHWSVSPADSSVVAFTDLLTTPLTVQAESTVTAMFVPRQVELVIDFDAGAGLVTVTGDGVTAVPGSPNHYLCDLDSTPVLTATPLTATGYVNTFVKWSEAAGANSINNITSDTVTLTFSPTDTQRSVRAVFASNTPSGWELLTATNNIAWGSASRAIDPASQEGDEIFVVSASPTSTGQFLFWDDGGYGNIQSAAAPSTRVLRNGIRGPATQTVTAVFQASEAVINVSIAGGSGQVTAQNGTQLFSFPSLQGSELSALLGSNVYFIATPSPGFRLQQWLVDGAPVSAGPANTHVLGVSNLVHTVVAVFEPVENFLLVVKLLRNDPASTAWMDVPGAPPAGVSDTSVLVTRVVGSGVVVPMTVQLSPGANEVVSSAVTDVAGVVPAVLGPNAYSVVVNQNTTVTLTLGPANYRLALKVNPASAGTAEAAVTMVAGTPVPPPVTFSEGGGTYLPHSTVTLRYTPSSTTPMPFRWNVLSGDVVVTNPYAAETTIVFDPLTVLSFYNEIEVVTGAPRSYMTRPDLDVKIDPLATDSPLRPEARLNDPKDKVPDHLISGREEEPKKTP